MGPASGAWPDIGRSGTSMWRLAPIARSMDREHTGERRICSIGSVPARNHRPASPSARRPRMGLVAGFPRGEEVRYQGVDPLAVPLSVESVDQANTSPGVPRTLPSAVP